MDSIYVLVQGLHVVESVIISIETRGALKTMRRDVRSPFQAVELQATQDTAGDEWISDGTLNEDLLTVHTTGVRVN